MKKVSIQIIFLVLILISCTKISFSQEQPKSLLFRTEIKAFHSNVLRQDFEIKISLPVDYYKNEMSFYPTLYCTDGNRNFNLVSNIVEILTFPEASISKMLVVGISYKISGLEDWAAWRNRDLLPTNDSAVDKKWESVLAQLSGRNNIVSKSGQASKFLEFMSAELIPYIEMNYRVKKNDRALLGYSYGGLFTLYTMFNYPEIFQRYYAGSPSLNWDNKVIFKYEKKYSETHKDLQANIFLSYGGLEDKSSIENMNRLIEKMKSHNYPNLKIESYVFEGENHTSCYASGVCRALRIIFRDNDD